MAKAILAIVMIGFPLALFLMGAASFLARQTGIDTRHPRFHVYNLVTTGTILFLTAMLILFTRMV